MLYFYIYILLLYAVIPVMILVGIKRKSRFAIPPGHQRWADAPVCHAARTGTSTHQLGLNI